MALDPTKQETYLTSLGHAISRRNCMLMAGYGLTSLVSTKDRPYPRCPPRTSTEMLQEMAVQCSRRGFINNEEEREQFEKLLASKEFSAAGVMIEKWQPNRLKQKEYLTEILLCDPALTPKCQAHRLIAKIPFCGYLTTTYDIFIEASYYQVHKFKLTTFDYSEIKRANEHSVNTKNSFVLKLHGDVSPPLLITLSDFDFKKRLTSENGEQKSGWCKLLEGAHVLFIGFENDGPGLQCIRYFFEQQLFYSTDHWIAVSGDLDKDSKGFLNTLAKQYEKLHIIQYDSDLMAFLQQIAIPPFPKTQVKRDKAAQSTSESPIDTFIAHTNAKEDKKLIDQLNIHLDSLKQSKQFTIWSMQDFRGGADRKSSIQEHVASAQIILLLISPHFLADSECKSIMRQAMERCKEESEDRRPTVIPIILRECDWESGPLKGLQSIPRDGGSVDQHENRNAAFAEISREIRKEATIRQSKAISTTSKRQSPNKSVPH